MTTTTVTPADLAVQLKTLAAQLHDALNDEDLSPADRIAVLPDLHEAGVEFGGVLRAAGCGNYEQAVGAEIRAIWEPVCDAADKAGSLIVEGALAVEEVNAMAEDALLAQRKVMA